jgi:hypothetical protein
MPRLDLAGHWFDRIPTALIEWGGYFAAIRFELETLINSGHIGNAIVYIPEEEPDEDVYRSEFDEPFRLSYSFFDDCILVSFSNNKISGDQFTVNLDLTWSYDPEDMGTIGGLSPEFVLWLNNQESLAGKAAVLSIAIAKAWLINPPSSSAGLAFETSKPWAH